MDGAVGVVSALSLHLARRRCRRLGERRSERVSLPFC